MFNRKSNRPRLSVQSLEGREVCSTLIELGNIPHPPTGAIGQISTVKLAPPATAPIAPQQ